MYGINTNQKLFWLEQQTTPRSRNNSHKRLRMRPRMKSTMDFVFCQSTVALISEG